MTKELEALERYHRLDVLVENGNDLILKDEEEYKILKQALQHLEFIDNANPSEALEYLEKVKSHFRVIDQDILMKEKKFEYIWLKPYDEYCDTIKQALLKAQEQEKVLSIIKEKNVDIFFIKFCKAVEKYNLEICKNSSFAYGLTEEEFELLKEILK